MSLGYRGLSLFSVGSVAWFPCHHRDALLLANMHFHLLVFVFIFAVCEAARSRTVIVRRPASERYDREITTFDPSGRLLQVEYSMEAAGRGSPVIGFLHEESVIVLVGQSQDSESKPGLLSSQVVASLSPTKVHRLDEHVYLFTSAGWTCYNTRSWDDNYMKEEEIPEGSINDKN